MDLEHVDYRPRYRLCRVGLFLAAVASGVMASEDLGFLGFLLTLHRPIHEFLSSPGWLWFGGTAMAWTALLGSYLLWGRWSEPDWQKRSGTLVLIALCGVGVWVWQHREAFGLFGQGHPQTDWTTEIARKGLRWGWLLLLTGLAADVAVHLGREEAQESRASLYALITAGMAVWVFHVINSTDWAGGWPLRPGGFRQTTWLMLLGVTGLRSLSAFLVTALSLLASRECGRIVRELDQAEKGLDLFPTPSESGWGASPPGR